jgi:uncharacterized protein YggT (Ycf19 family)
VVVLRYLIEAAKALIVVDAVLSWVMGPAQMPRAFTKAILDPVYAPIRNGLSGLRWPVDVAPLIAIAFVFALQFAFFGRKKLPEELR